MDWSLLPTLNDFMAGHEGTEETLLFYVEVSEALFAATLLARLPFRPRPEEGGDGGPSPCETPASPSRARQADL